MMTEQDRRRIDVLEQSTRSQHLEILDLRGKIAQLEWENIKNRPLGPLPDSVIPEHEKEEALKRIIDRAVKAENEVHEVDRSARVLADGSPVPENDSHTEIESATGMQKAYVVLSAEERAKGFARPVRRSYRHVGLLGPSRPLRTLTEEEKVRYAAFNYVMYEEYESAKEPLIGRFWTQEMLDHIGKGCGQVTDMAQSIAETFARDPHFYSGGYCATCRTHFPNEEFRWLDGSRVGE